MLSTIGSFGIPLCVEVCNGAASDDVLYLPMIARVEKTLDSQGLLFMGDTKLGSWGNRCTITQKGHYYLTPLSRVQVSFNHLQDLVKSAQEFIYFGDNNGIKAFEQRIKRQHEGHTWQERLIIAILSKSKAAGFTTAGWGVGSKINAFELWKKK